MSQPSALPDDDLGAILQDPSARAWFEKHRTELQQDAYGQRILYQILAAAFVVGLAAYIGGYFLRSTATNEPLGLLADLLYSFGFALWTAAVVVVLVEIIPEVKRRQIRHALEAYEAARSDKTPQKE
jgi:hypothetical protein